MKTKDLQQYIGAFMNDPNPDKELAELENAKMLISFYLAGLQMKEMPLDIFSERNEETRAKEVSLGRIPEPYHRLVAFLAILKAETDKGNTGDYLRKSVSMENQSLISYFFKK